MASRERDDEKGFLSRWSQRKREAEEEAAAGALGAPQGGAGPQRVAAPDAAGVPAAEDPEPIDPRDLPDIDTLDAGSDFSVFMKDGVPQALKQRALRKLWHVDPAFREICMLDDYNLDYTDAAMVVPNMKTIYQVGKGMVLPDDEKPEDEEQPGEDHQEDAESPQIASEDGGGGEGGDAAAPAAPEGDPVESLEALPPRESLEALPPLAGSLTPESLPVRKGPRKPTGPLVSGLATPRSGGQRSTPRSARQRRWGDPENN
ncbi:MAG: DUF3306 domain-containing protein [Kiloniellaceae bacterium]|nr:DUF3306 domain-containing protein [Kiloniellaceae bacterium]